MRFSVFWRHVHHYLRSRSQDRYHFSLGLIRLHDAVHDDDGSFRRNETYAAARTLAFQDSPSDQSAIPSRARSLIRNCPGFPERAGKPPALGSQTPGVVKRKLRVVRNIPTARALPRAEARGENGRAAISSATATSTTPSAAEKPRTLSNP